MDRRKRPARGSRAHLESAGEGYGEHLRVASTIGFTMIAAGAACVVHGLVPRLFTTTGSRAIKRLNERISSRHAGEMKQALHQLEYEI